MNRVPKKSKYKKKIIFFFFYRGNKKKTIYLDELLQGLQIKSKSSKIDDSISLMVNYSETFKGKLTKKFKQKEI